LWCRLLNAETEGGGAPINHKQKKILIMRNNQQKARSDAVELIAIIDVAIASTRSVFSL
jgi:hypothetical protein